MFQTVLTYIFVCTLPHPTFPGTQQFVVDISPDIWFRNTTNVRILHLNNDLRSFGVWCCTYTMTFVHLVLYIYDILGLHTTNVITFYTSVCGIIHHYNTSVCDVASIQ